MNFLKAGRRVKVRGVEGKSLDSRWEKVGILKLNILSDSCSAEYNEIDV